MDEIQTTQEQIDGWRNQISMASNTVGLSADITNEEFRALLEDHATLQARVNELEEQKAKSCCCTFCQEHVAYSSVYRCYDCDGSFHKDCLKLHIRQSDPRQYRCANAMEQENIALLAQVERLTRPVTDEEWDEHAEWHYSGEPERLLRVQIDALIAARAKEQA